MKIQEIHDRLHQAFQQWLVGNNFEAIDPWIEIKAEGLPEIARFLRDEPDLRFDMLHCITAVDYFEPDAKEGGPGRVAAARRVDLSPVEHDASPPPGVEGQPAALAGRRSRANCPRSPASAAFGARPSGTSARCST